MTDTEAARGAHSPLDPVRLKAATPGAANRLHLDNAGAALMPESVISALTDHIALEARVGGYVAQERVADRLAALYPRLAALFGGAADDYAFTASAVDAWTRAFYSVPMAAGDNLVTAYNDYCSNYVAYLHRAERDGVEIRVAGSPGSGITDADVARLIDRRTRLVSLSHVPSSSGEVNPVAAIGAVCRAADVPFLLDACQSAGQLPLDVARIGCHMMTGTGRKFLRGPRGTGFLYVRADMRERLLPVMLTNTTGWVAQDRIQIPDSTRMFEAWERSVAGQLGLLAALDGLWATGPQAVHDRIAALAERLRRGLAALEGVEMGCPEGASAGIVTFTLAGRSPQQVKAALEAEDIAVQVASVAHTRRDLEPRGIDSLVRVSPHVYVLEAEIDRFLDRVAAL
ncbi:aminotransferase class V-fold PLP-dependent enzyme [Yunchengibacter salinarum]|uniref:aminotransferase class V-fold PLP-dependent enzyme n=1 Tax=Yunchengibacter salinarum TaxID=3133399 RepID=UPI0035B5B09F